MKNPRRPPRPKHETLQFVKVQGHHVRLDLVLRFKESVSLAEAQSLARNLLETMEVQATGELPPQLEAVSLRAPDLRQIVRVKTG